MKKYMKAICLLLSLFVLSGCIGFGGAKHYSSVANYNKANDNSFFDFYHPESYFDTTIEKKTLSEINKIKIYYDIDPKNNYSMSFKIGDIEVAYIVDSENYSDELKNYRQVFVEGVDRGYKIYAQYDSNCVSVLYPLEDKNIEIIIRTFKGALDTDTDMIAISMMVGALQLNQ